MAIGRLFYLRGIFSLWICLRYSLESVRGGLGESLGDEERVENVQTWSGDVAVVYKHVTPI
jgi:hypothetical protein